MAEGKEEQAEHADAHAWASDIKHFYEEKARGEEGAQSVSL